MSSHPSSLAKPAPLEEVAPGIDLQAPGGLTPDPASMSLGAVAARGMVFMLGQTIGSKFINLITQIVLTWLLTREDFGAVAPAYALTAFAFMIQDAGLRDVLVQRQRHFHRWRNPAFWIALTTGWIGAGVGLLIAGAVWMFGAGQLAGLMALLACGLPISSLGIVPEAQLRSQLRFRLLAAIGLISVAQTAVLNIALAWVGFGPYSLVIPMVAGFFTSTALMWSFARPAVRRDPQFRRWRFLLPDGARAFVGGFLLTMFSQIDYLVLAALHSKAVVGIYYYALIQSTQVLRILMGNLINVLMPSLSRMQDQPARQFRALMEATHLLALLGLPACFMQAALAGPLVRLLLNDGFHDVIPVLEVLSIGMGFCLVAGTAISAMKAQGRFGALMASYAVMDVIFFIVVFAIAWFAREDRAAYQVAIGAAICYGLSGPVQLYLAIAPVGGGWRDIMRVFAAPLLISLIAVLPPYLLARWSRLWLGSDALQIVVFMLPSALLYLLSARRLDPHAWAMLINRLRGLVQRTG